MIFLEIVQAISFRNRCEVTGRTRGVYRKFGLSRIKLRELTMSGHCLVLLSLVGKEKNYGI